MSIQHKNKNLRQTNTYTIKKVTNLLLIIVLLFFSINITSQNYKEADLSLEKSVDNPIVNIGETVYFTVVTTHWAIDQ